MGPSLPPSQRPSLPLYLCVRPLSLATWCRYLTTATVLSYFTRFTQATYTLRRCRVKPHEPFRGFLNSLPLLFPSTFLPVSFLSLFSFSRTTVKQKKINIRFALLRAPRMQNVLNPRNSSSPSLTPPPPPLLPNQPTVLVQEPCRSLLRILDRPTPRPRKTYIR